MIHIERESVDEHGRPIRPGDDWFSDSVAATERAIRERDTHEIDDNLYKHVQVKTALEKLFHDKCAYCEWNMTGGSDWDVEHFRQRDVSQNGKIIPATTGLPTRGLTSTRHALIATRSGRISRGGLIQPNFRLLGSWISFPSKTNPLV